MVAVNKKEQLEEISKSVENCKMCPLYKTATNPVPGDGNSDTELMFVGEAPGFHEDQQGIPFVGRAGKLLEFMLKQIGYERKEIWIGNILKHRPPNNRDPDPSEILACKLYLTKQIEIISPKVIVTLGRFAMNYFLTNAKISQAHGEPFVLKDYIVYPVYHPAAGLRNGKIKTELITDFLKIPKILRMKTDELKPVKFSQIKRKGEPKQMNLLG